MTELLYLQDSYLMSFQSTIESVDIENGTIELKSTAFHGQGGHQVCDHGKIMQGAFAYEISNVRNNDGTIYHYVANKEDLKHINIKDMAYGNIDFDRRYQLMKTHTAQHLFSAIARNMFNLNTADAVIEENFCSIKFDKPFDPRQMLELQNEANRLLKRNITVDRTNNNGVYHVKIGELDNKKCGCTHVKNLQEIERIYIYKITADRVCFKVGYQAEQEQTKNQSDILHILTARDIGLMDLFTAYKHLTEKEKGLSAEITDLGKSLLRLELLNKDKTYNSTNKNLIVTKRPELDIKTVLQVVNNHLVSDEKTIIVICKKNTVVVCSNIKSVPANDITAILKNNNPLFQSRGNINFSQGGAWGRGVQETYDLIEAALLEVPDSLIK